MKLIVGTGSTLTVRDVGPILVELRRREPGGVPIKFNKSVVISDGEARAVVREQINLGLYDRVV